MSVPEKPAYGPHRYKLKVTDFDNTLTAICEQGIDFFQEKQPAVCTARQSNNPNNCPKTGKTVEIFYTIDHVFFKKYANALNNNYFLRLA